MNSNHLEWINLGQHHHGLDRGAKTRIRAHAMRATAEKRRASATWGKINQRQYPTRAAMVPEVDEHKGVVDKDGENERAKQLVPINFNSSRRAHPSSSRSAGVSEARSSQALVPIRSTRGYAMERRMPLMGLELMRAELGIDVLDLSVLTVVQIGQTASALLGAKPNRLSRLMTRRRRSYLSYVPARYGQCSYLDDTIRCLVIRARRRLAPPDQVSEASEIASYGRALKSLQAAIDGVEACDDPDVLCAVEVLSLFELLDHSRPDAWSKHIAGAARLVQLRGADNFRTEYEKSLLASLCGTIACECWRSYDACFFDQPEWQSALKSIIIEDGEPFCLRSAISTRLWCRTVGLPRLFRRVGDVVYGDRSPSQDELHILREDVKRFRGYIARWHEEFEDLMKQQPVYRFYPSDYDMRYELLGGYHGVVSVTLRLQTALDGTDLGTLEQEALFHAGCLKHIFDDVSSRNTWAGFFLEQKLNFEIAIMATTDLWMENQHLPGQLIQKWKFAAYHHAIMHGQSCSCPFGGESVFAACPDRDGPLSTMTVRGHTRMEEVGEVRIDDGVTSS